MTEQFVYINEKTETKRLGYKTFRGMVTLFKKINKECKKKGIKLNFTIQLPIKD